MADSLTNECATLRARSCWAPVAAWMAAIFGISSLPKVPLADKISVSDKLLHAVAFGLLAALVLRALPQRTAWWARLIAPVVWAVAYGYSDEFHQRFVPGRDFDMLDLAADGVGAAVATIGLLAWGRASKRGAS